MSSLAWKNINWSLVNSRIYRYQTRIYKASKENNIYKVRSIQKLIINSLDAKLVAVKRVTAFNKNETTLGLEKKVFITDLQKEKLVKRLRLDGKISSTLRLYNDKSGKIKKWSVDFVTVKDQAKQVLCLLALEPEWEANFETNSYGFRPGRCCHDAVETVFLSLQRYSRKGNYQNYILYAYITKCFNQIDYEYLIKKLNTLPEMKIQIKAWLKAGILEDFLDVDNRNSMMEDIIYQPSVGIISPLLTNIVLHGLEKHIKEWTHNRSSFVTVNRYGQTKKRQSLSVIRYANELLLIHPDKTIIYEAKKEISQWLLNGSSFQFNNEKTYIGNSKDGFNFLRFTFITIKKNNKIRTKIYPSRKSQELLILKVRNVIQKNQNVSAYKLISLLRPIIIDWANYFKYSECEKCFQNLTNLIVQQLRAWVFRRDTRNGRKKVKQKYFSNTKEYYFNFTQHNDNWILNGKTKNNNDTIKENWLPHLMWVKGEKWIKIKDNKSPFDGDIMYWNKRKINKVN